MSLTDAIRELASSWGQAWNKPLDEPLRPGMRFGFALSGSAPWIAVNYADLEWFNAATLFGFQWVALLAVVVVASWFALLISYQARRCSPTRYFLEGLLFPGVVAVLLQGPLSQLYGA